MESSAKAQPAIYLASPYSHTDRDVRIQRYRAACETAATLIRAGRLVFSPVAHAHPIAECGLPTEWTFWQGLDERLLRACDEVMVLMLEGWRDSAGVQAEIRLAGELGKPVRYLAPEDAGLPTFTSVASQAPP